MLSHQIESRSREKYLRSPDFYLRPPRPSAGNSNVINRLDRLAARSDAVIVRRIRREA